ncbi:MAG: uracil-DNA glycosylase [Gemmatimonadaceae bacterium]|nr:uracil-DNA glycosylase [Gemmatimonadaceae bacterium]
MDPREQLRIYLEQRRETGETELVLDKLSIDEVLRIIAGQASSARGTAVAAAAAAEKEHPTSARAAEPGSADWREALREAGVAQPPSGAKPAGPAPAPKMEAPPPIDAPAPAAEPPKPPGVPRLAFPQPGHEAGAPGALEEFRTGIVVGAADSELFHSPFAHLESLDAIAETVRGCTLCPLYATATQSVPGEGSPTADLVCVGEAPGANEDATGRPFVGEAGKLLTKILEAIKLSREEVFICNVLKHRPPGNRNPLPGEVEACSPYLVRQLEVIQPKVIVAFGTFAAQTLLNTKSSLSQLRGFVHRYYGTPLIVTYHPAALLRNPAWKRPTWNDVQLARRVLDNARQGS